MALRESLLSVAFNLRFLQGKVGGETVVRWAASNCPRLYEAMLKTSAHIADRVPGKSQAKKQDMVTTPQFLHPAELVLRFCEDQTVGPTPKIFPRHSV